MLLPLGGDTKPVPIVPEPLACGGAPERRTPSTHLAPVPGTPPAHNIRQMAANASNRCARAGRRVAGAIRWSRSGAWDRRAGLQRCQRA